MARFCIDQSEAIRRRLPPVCMQCGAPADDYVTKTFSWYPSWVFVFILCGLLPLLIIALLMTKRMTVDCPMCPEHRNHWSKRSQFTWLGFFGVIAIGVVFLVIGGELQNNKDTPIDAILGITWAVLFLGWLVAAAVYSQSAIRADQITEYDITLLKLSPEFIEALEDDRYRDKEDRLERRREREFDRERDEEGDFYRERD